MSSSAIYICSVTDADIWDQKKSSIHLFYPKQACEDGPTISTGFLVLKWTFLNGSNRTKDFEIQLKLHLIYTRERGVNSG